MFSRVHTSRVPAAGGPDTYMFLGQGLVTILTVGGLALNVVTRIIDGRSQLTLAAGSDRRDWSEAYEWLGEWPS